MADDAVSALDWYLRNGSHIRMTPPANPAIAIQREFYNEQLGVPHTPQTSPVRRAVGSVIPTELMSADYTSFELRAKRRAFDYYNSGLYNQRLGVAQTPPAATTEVPAVEPVKYVKQYYKQILLLTDLQHSDELPPVDQEATLQAVTSLLLQPPADFRLIANYTFWLHDLARRCNIPEAATGPRLFHVCLAGAYFTAVAAQNANFYEGANTVISGLSMVGYSSISGEKRADTCIVVLGGSKETAGELTNLREWNGDYALFAFPETGGLAASLADTPNVCIPTPELQELPWPEKFQQQLQHWAAEDTCDLPDLQPAWALPGLLSPWQVNIVNPLT